MTMLIGGIATLAAVLGGSFDPFTPNTPGSWCAAPTTRIEILWHCDEPGEVLDSTLFVLAYCSSNPPCFPDEIDCYSPSCPPRVFEQIDGPGEALAICGNGNSVGEAGSNCDLNDLAGCSVIGAAFALAETRSPVQAGDPLIIQETFSFLEGFAHAVAIVNDLEGGCPGSLQISGELPLPSLFVFDPSDRIQRLAVFANGQWFYILYSNLGVRSVGLQFDEATGMFLLDGTIPYDPGNPGVMLCQFEFDDDTYDLNGDGRFNQADVDLIAMEVGTSDEDTIALFDLDADGAVTSADVDIFQSMIDNGLDSGFFGDPNGDGFTTCAELDDLRSRLDSTLSDSAYVIEYDDDLDGDIDADDEAAMEAIAQHRADLDGDGIVGSGDSAILIAAWGTDDEAADLNGNGDVESNDLALLIAAWGQGC